LQVATAPAQPAPVRSFGATVGSRSGNKLNATVDGVSGGSAAGALTYTPVSGTVLAVGTHTLSVSAAATANYLAASRTVQIVVTSTTVAPGVTWQLLPGQVNSFGNTNLRNVTYVATYSAGRSTPQKTDFNVMGGTISSIIPIAMQDPSNSKTAATRFSAFDFGAIPGYAYVNRIKNWQFCGWFGLGGVIQSKFYRLDHQSRGFLGLAPRYDIRIMGGYSNKDFFVFLVTDFDNKSIRFSDLVYRQYYYMVKITGGLRLGNKGKQKS
jgi:hypothetical protein